MKIRPDSWLVISLSSTMTTKWATDQSAIRTNFHA